MSSLLPDLNIHDAVVAHDDNLKENADKRYRESVGRAHAALAKLTRKAGAQHDDPTDAMNAAADLLERFADGVQGNGDAIVASLAQQQAASTMQVAQVRELEGKVAELEQNNADLERGARRASNLQAQLDQLQANNNRLERELSASQAEVRELKSGADKPNPLSERVRQLEAENSDLKSKLDQANADKAQAESGRQELQQQLDAIRAEQEQQVAQPDSQSGDTGFIGGAMDSQNGGSSGEPSPQEDKPKIRERVMGVFTGDRVDRRHN